MGHVDTTLSFEDLQQIMALHLEGMSSVQIGRQYNRDHSTILYHLKKMRMYGVLPPKIMREKKKKTVVIIDTGEYKYKKILEERTNKGKNYRYYLNEARKRDPVHYGPKKTPEGKPILFDIDNPQERHFDFWDDI